MFGGPPQLGVVGKPVFAVHAGVAGQTDVQAAGVAGGTSGIRHKIIRVAQNEVAVGAGEHVIARAVSGIRLPLGDGNAVSFRRALHRVDADRLNSIEGAVADTGHVRGEIGIVADFCFHGSSFFLG